MKPWLKWSLLALAGACLLLVTAVLWLSYGPKEPRAEYTKNIGDGWFIENLPKGLPEPGPSPSNLYRAKGRGYVWVDQMIRQYRFYEPDCLIYSRWRDNQDVFAVCGDRVPVGIASAFTSWKFEADGLRNTLPLRLQDGRLVQMDEVLPLDDIKALALQQSPFHRDWANSGGFDSHHPLLRPVRRDLPVDVQKTPPEGQPALVDAVRNHRLDVINALLRAGGSPNERTDWGATVLEIAAGNGDLAVLDALIAAGADVNAQEYGTGVTALMRAADVGEKEAVKHLLAAGADPSLRDSESHTAIERIPSSQDAEMLDLLRSGAAARR